MENTNSKLSAQDGVILFCAAMGLDHAEVGILAQDMQSMAIRGFIAHDRERGAYILTDHGYAAFTEILHDAGFK
jgi:hypothetical protein